MSLDSRIRSVLDHEARTVETPWPPPLDGLLVGGLAERRRRRRRRVLAGALAGSIILVAVTGSLLVAGPDMGSDAPVAQEFRQQLAELPVGEPPRTLYCMSGRLWWGSESWEMADGDCSWPDRLAQVGDTALGVDSATASISVFDADGRHPVRGRVDAESSPVVLSPDGKIAGWVLLDQVEGRQPIVLWDTERRVEWKRVVAPTSDLLNLEGIDASGRVYLTSVKGQGSATRIWVWPSQERGSHFLRVTGIGEFVTVVDVPPDGLAVLTSLEEAEGRGVAVWGTVTDEGRFLLREAGDVRPAVWAPDRSRYAALTASSISVFSETGSPEVEIPMPLDARPEGEPTWESSEQVLVPVRSVAAGSDLTTWILRCAVEEGGCEVAARGRQDVLLPAYGGFKGPIDPAS